MYKVLTVIGLSSDAIPSAQAWNEQSAEDLWKGTFTNTTT